MAVGHLLQETAQAVQQALTPVFLLSAVAALLNVFAGRLAQVSAQVDALAAGVEIDMDVDLRLRWLRRRLLALDAAVLLGAFACCCTCGVVLALFAGASLGAAPQPRLVAVLFSSAVALTLASVLAFVVEMLGAAHGVRRVVERHTDAEIRRCQPGVEPPRPQSVAVLATEGHTRMSLFGSIMSRIFGGRDANAAPQPAPGAAATTPASGGTAPAMATPTAAPGASPSAATAPAMSQVDVAAVLGGMAEKHPEKLNWRTSIVDLMKLLGLDSSLDQRKALAQELGYTGSTSDSAAMNIWLHKQVMRKLAENGGKVPEDLKD